MKTKPKENSIIAILIVVLILILVSLAIWGMFYVDDIDSKISIIGIIAIIIATFTSIMTVNINNKQIKEREYEFHVLKERQKVCEHFYNIIVDVVKDLKKIEKRDARIVTKITAEMFLFKKCLMNWGSEELIEKFIKYDNDNKTNEGDAGAVMTNINTFLKELRKELGFKDSKNLNLIGLLLPTETRKELKDDQP